ncbi:terminase small subunit [Leadbettera azotonutricia]|uniref:Putative phage terminase, small subunit n=1 Tax=Leadbettera azotonutricia (strain ATCC BAA-888 / DSM 13862 / ZAS-9) TaxID=545695 RepID=F5YF67_LEAAZ|nr:terminase small subunit [Leadbettera azotonutricia]AEF82915.1 putative phage terminase, small subunit [Leadbettera azotonutricia ZAS-9]
MTKARKNFITAYIEQDFTNATAAYMKAYPRASEESARCNASRMLTNDNIQSYISEILAGAIRQNKVPLEKRIFDYWMKRAFYRITDIIDLDGTMLMNKEQLQESGLHVCIDSINEKIDAQGHSTVTYKFADRDEAVKMLQQYIQMIKPQEIKVGIQLMKIDADDELALQ